MTVEQIVRNLLERAVEDGLVDPADSQWEDPDPQARSAEDLAGVANLLAACLRRAAERPATRESVHAENG